VRSMSRRRSNCRALSLRVRQQTMIAQDAYEWGRPTHRRHIDVVALEATCDE
jgi:hypothetical protein